MVDGKDLSSSWRFRAGFTSGLGFGIGLLVIILAWEWIDTYRKSPELAEFSEKSNVVVNSHRVAKDMNLSHIATRSFGLAAWGAQLHSANRWTRW